MKFLVLALAATLSTLSALSQPILNEQYHARMGNSFNYNEVEDTAQVFAPALGPNQTWNLTGLQGTSPFPLTATILEPQSGQGAGSFPGATHRLSLSSMGISMGDSYFISNASGFYVGGSYGFGGTLIRYSPAIKYMPTGLSLNQGFDQSFLETTTEPGSAPKYYQNEESTLFAGYGTLQLASGTYANAILVKTHNRGFTAASPTGPFALADSSDRYSWFVPGLGYPIAEFTIGAVNKGASWERNLSGSFLSDILMAGKPRLSVQTLNLFPQPATNYVTLGVPSSEEALSATLFDATGRQVAELPLRQGQISLATVQPGSYWVEVRGRKVYRAQLVKA